MYIDDDIDSKNKAQLKNLSNENLKNIFQKLKELPFLQQVTCEKPQIYDIINSSKSVFFYENIAKLLSQSEYKEYHNIFLKKIINTQNTEKLKITLTINVKQYIFIGLITEDSIKEYSFIKGAGGIGIMNLNKLMVKDKIIKEILIDKEDNLTNAEVTMLIEKNKIYFINKKSNQEIIENSLSFKQNVNYKPIIQILDLYDKVEIIKIEEDS